MVKKKVMSKSMAAEKARKGMDMGNPGKGFAKGVNSMMAKGMPMEKARKIMGSQFQKMRRAGKL